MRDDVLSEAQREVDAMLPGTPRIGPPLPPPKVYGDARMRETAPNLRNSIGAYDGVLSAFLVVGALIAFAWGQWRIICREMESSEAIEREKQQVVIVRRAVRDIDQRIRFLEADDEILRVKIEHIGRMLDEMHGK